MLAGAGFGYNTTVLYYGVCSEITANLLITSSVLSINNKCLQNYKWQGILEYPGKVLELQNTGVELLELFNLPEDFPMFGWGNKIRPPSIHIRVEVNQWFGWREVWNWKPSFGLGYLLS